MASGPGGGAGRRRCTPRPRRRARSAESRCVVITWPAPGAALVLVSCSLPRTPRGEALRRERLQHLRAHAAISGLPGLGRSPAMPLLRYRKVVILGYRSVGKTSLAHQFVEGEFVEGYDPTVENTYSKIVTLGKDEFHLHLVDTAGQDEYSILPHSLIIGVHGYVLVYSVTSLHSFQVIESLYQKLHEGHGKTRLPVVLVGNKADLSLNREVQAVEGKKLAESWGATFLESSARENQPTRSIFIKVIQEITRVENSYGQERRCHIT